MDFVSTSENIQNYLTMGYDGRGRRITKADASIITYQYYLDRDSVIEERYSTFAGIPIRQYVWGKRYIDELLQTSINSAPGSTHMNCDVNYWALQDANWNVLGIVDEDGVLKERYEYTPYGQRSTFISYGVNDPNCMTLAYRSPRVVAYGAITEPWGLCEVGHQGLIHDEETGLIHTPWRDLNPVLERWMQREPLGGLYVDEMHLYQCVDGNPINHGDPSGMYDETGHFYTVYSESAAYFQAYYAQFPDQQGDFRAVDTILAAMQANEISSPFLGAWAEDINRILHSLHGGDAAAVQNRRDCLLKMLKVGGNDGNSDSLTPMERGLIEHALGDAYAHTGADGSQYGYPTGHLKPEPGLGHAQDHIATNPAAYRAYVLSLYSSMSGGPVVSNQALQKLLAAIPSFDDDESKSLATMQSLARDAGYNRSFLPGGDRLDPSMHQVTKGEMQDLMNKIRKSCGCK